MLTMIADAQAQDNRQSPAQSSLGKAIAERRQAKGWDQAALAKEVDVDPSTVSRIEAGRSEPSLGTLRRLASALGARVEELLMEHSA